MVKQQRFTRREFAVSKPKHQPLAEGVKLARCTWLRHAGSASATACQVVFGHWNHRVWLARRTHAHRRVIFVCKVHMKFPKQQSVWRCAQAHEIVWPADWRE